MSDEIYIRRTKNLVNGILENVEIGVELGEFYCELEINSSNERVEISNPNGAFAPFYTIPGYVRLDAVSDFLNSHFLPSIDRKLPSDIDNLMWDHNGSLMRSNVIADSITITYEKPRTGLARAKVEPGTVLFEGSLTSDQIIGHATLFSSKNCAPLKYTVSGKLSDFKKGFVVLRGAVPIRGKGCNVVGSKVTGGNANLRFDIVNSTLFTIERNVQHSYC